MVKENEKKAQSSVLCGAARRQHQCLILQASQAPVFSRKCNEGTCLFYPKDSSATDVWETAGVKGMIFEGPAAQSLGASCSKEPYNCFNALLLSS